MDRREPDHPVEQSHALTRLDTLLEEVWDEYPADARVDHDATLLDLGVDSLTLVTWLDRVENEFYMEWDPADPPNGYSSLRSIARCAVGLVPRRHPHEPPRHVGPDEYRRLMSSFPTGVAVVTSVGADHSPRGATCSSLASITLDPPTLLVSLTTRSGTLAAILQRRCFAVNLLHARARRTAEIFSSPVADRFRHVPWRPTDAEGLPWLERDTLAVAECTVAQLLAVGDHTLVLGEVSNVLMLPDVPLLYGMRQFSTWQIGVPEHADPVPADRSER